MADEVLAVESVPLEEDFDTLVASLAIDDTLEDKLAKLKKDVDEKLADYADVKRIEKDEDFKAAKKYRTAVNDVKKPIEAQRKAAKKKYSDLLKTFDKTIGEITAPIDKLSDEYKAEIDRYDGECRARRLAALSGHYYDLAGEMGPLVPYERIADDKWLNASFGEVKAKNIIERRVGELLHQFKFVNGLDYADESEKAWAVAWWTRTLPMDSGEVAAAVAAHREEVAKAATLVSTYEQATAPEPEPVAVEQPEPMNDEQPEPEGPFGGPRCVRVVPSHPEPEVAEDAASAPQRGYRVVIECATADELLRVRAVMVENGIHGHVERMYDMEEKNLPPTRTPEQRKEAMAKAVHTRRERAAFKAACKAGNIPPEAAIEAPIAQRLKVEEFARSFPGIGTVKAKVIVKALDIPDGRRVSGLGYMQGPRLVAFIKNNMTAKEDGQ